jgi:hypothetical protein
MLGASGKLDRRTVVLLSAITAVPERTIAAAVVLPNRRNWLRAPWFLRAKGGGAMVIGRRIYFTMRWFDPNKADDVSVLRLLSHEVGHLVQAERFGLGAWGRCRYVAWFAAQYGQNLLRGEPRVHAAAKGEREAELGRWVLDRWLADSARSKFALAAWRNGDLAALKESLSADRDAISQWQKAYRKRFLKPQSTRLL